MKAALRTARRLGQCEGNRAWLSSTSKLQQAAEAAPTVGPLKDALPPCTVTKALCMHQSMHQSMHGRPLPPPPAPPPPLQTWSCVKIGAACRFQMQLSTAMRYLRPTETHLEYCR